MAEPLDYSSQTSQPGRVRLPLNWLGPAASFFGIAAAVVGFTAHAGKGEGGPAIAACAMLSAVALLLVLLGSFSQHVERVSVLVGLVMLVVGIGGMLHLINVERESRNSLPCPTHLRQMGLALLLYADAHHGQLPDSIEELVVTDDIPSEILTCPSTNDRPAKGKGEVLRAELKKPGHNSYIYLGAGKNITEFTANNVLAYDKPANHAPAGVNALFGDGHVEYIFPQQISSFLSRPLNSTAVTRSTTVP